MDVRWQEWTVVHISMFVTFILTAFICNVLNLAIYLVIRPLNIDQYRALSQCLLWIINSQVLDLRGTISLRARVHIPGNFEIPN